MAAQMRGHSSTSGGSRFTMAARPVDGRAKFLLWRLGRAHLAKYRHWERGGPGRRVSDYEGEEAGTVER